VEASLTVLSRQQAQFEQLFRQTPDTMAEYTALMRQYNAVLTIWTEKVRAYEQARAQQLIGKLSPDFIAAACAARPPRVPASCAVDGVGRRAGADAGHISGA
jgi:uncharacterized protein involved in exopolysaccharide biosynthesis